MTNEIRDAVMFVLGVGVGIIMMMFIITVLMVWIVISSTEVLTLVSEMGVDYIHLAKECNISGRI